jgi:hypothetical protein
VGAARSVNSPRKDLAVTTAAPPLERVPVERIQARAAEASPKHFAQLAVAGFFWLIGYLIRGLFMVAWKACVLCWSAARTGWEDYGGPSKRAQIAGLEAQLAQAMAALERFQV